MRKSDTISQNTPTASHVIIDYDSLRDKLYLVRNQQVMLDYDLAAIYGYTTSAFNQQVKNNLAKFEGEDFMFRLTREELLQLSISKNLTSIQIAGRKGGRTKPPLVFTEQGIYMLMTILRGPLAIKQSRALIRMFKAMKDYVIKQNSLLARDESSELVTTVSKNTELIKELMENHLITQKELMQINDKIKDAVFKSDISPIFLDFAINPTPYNYLFLNGEPARASETYIDIYSKAHRSIIIIDNYINIKSLRHLQGIKKGVNVLIYTDNLGHHLHEQDHRDFASEFPDINIIFKANQGKVHDRYLIIDHATKYQKIYHAGGSAKDAGYKVTSIVEMINDDVTSRFVEEMLGRLAINPLLRLK